MRLFSRSEERVAKSTILKRALQKSAMIFDQQARIVVSFDEEQELVTVRDASDIQKQSQISFQEAMPFNISTLNGVLSLEEWWSNHISK
ncbi:MAG: hypothetical protein AAF694_25270 [Bacteroidota bacterium]